MRPPDWLAWQLQAGGFDHCFPTLPIKPRVNGYARYTRDEWGFTTYDANGWPEYHVCGKVTDIVSGIDLRRDFPLTAVRYRVEAELLRYISENVDNPSLRKSALYHLNADLVQG